MLIYQMPDHFKSSSANSRHHWRDPIFRVPVIKNITINIIIINIIIINNIIIIGASS